MPPVQIRFTAEALSKLLEPIRYRLPILSPAPVPYLVEYAVYWGFTWPVGGGPPRGAFLGCFDMGCVPFSSLSSLCQIVNA